MPNVTEANNRGPLLNIASWLTTVIMCVSVGVKLYTRLAMTRRLHVDDLFIIVAMMTAAAYCIAAAEQVGNGLGQHEADISSQELDSYHKATYIAQIFYVLTVYVVKLAVLHFFINLTRLDMKRRVVDGFLVLVGVWTFIAVLVVAFQCRLPYPWDSRPGQCSNERAFWIFNAIIDILTQICASLMPIYLLSSLQLSKSKKRFMMISFSPNLATIPLIILRLIYLLRVIGSLNSTWDSFNLALVTSLHTNISVIAACISFFKPIIDSLAPGLIANDLHFSLESNEAQNAGTPRWNGFGIPHRETVLPRIYGSIQHSTLSAASPSSKCRRVEIPSHRDQWEMEDNTKMRQPKATHTVANMESI